MVSPLRDRTSSSIYIYLFGILAFKKNVVFTGILGDFKNFVDFFSKIDFFEKSDFLKMFIFFSKMSSIFFQEKKFFRENFRVFLFLWYIIPKMSNAELLTPPHTLLVMIYVSGIFSKIRKIPKILEIVLIRIIFHLI